MAVSACSTEPCSLKPLWRLSFALLMLMEGCRRAEGPDIYISWKAPKPGIQQGMPLRYESIQVGRVAHLNTAPDGVTVRAVLDRKYAHYVRIRTTFLFRPASGADGAFIQVISLDQDAPPAPPGAHFEGAESSLGVALDKIATDWQRTALFCGIGLCFALVLVATVKLLFKLWGVVLCTAGGAVTAAAFAPMVGSSLEPLLPEGTRVDLLSYLAAFLAGTLVVSVILGLVSRLLRSPA